MRDGGPAFPVAKQLGPNGDVEMWPEPGMTLRDYFAAAALTGLLAKHGLSVNVANDVRESGTLAYALADAMLAARDAKGGAS